MKNIIILGAGKTGKTTLSKMIKDKYNSYNLIHSDSLKWALIRAEGKEKEYKEDIDKLKHFEFGENFLYTLIEYFNASIESDKNEYGTILESEQLHPRLIMEKVDYSKTKIICLGHGEMSISDIIEQCEKFDTKESNTYGLTKQELEKLANYWYECNKVLKDECPKCGIQYVDTSKNRDEVLKDIVEHIVI